MLRLKGFLYPPKILLPFNLFIIIGVTMYKKVYIIGMMIIMIVSLSFGCASKEISYIELEIIEVEKTDNLQYLITHEDENGYIEMLNTKDTNDNNIFRFKIANDSNYKLYSANNMLIGGEYILYIPKSDVIV